MLIDLPPVVDSLVLALQVRRARVIRGRARSLRGGVAGGGAGGGERARAMTTVPMVPRMTSQDQAKRRVPVSERIKSTRFTSAIAIIAITLAASATGRRVRRPSKKTPSSEPKVTPAILKASQRIPSNAE